MRRGLHWDRQRRKVRTRFQVRRRANARPRLCVFRSSRHMSVQIIDDVQQRTLVSASSLEADVKKMALKGCTLAEKVGGLVAERALKVSVTEVVFDRGACLYHGRVKALADGARAAGLAF